MIYAILGIIIFVLVLVCVELTSQRNDHRQEAYNAIRNYSLIQKVAQSHTLTVNNKGGDWVVLQNRSLISRHKEVLLEGIKKNLPALVPDNKYKLNIKIYPVLTNGLSGDAVERWFIVSGNSVLDTLENMLDVQFTACTHAVDITWTLSNSAEEAQKNWDRPVLIVQVLIDQDELVTIENTNTKFSDTEIFKLQMVKSDK